MRRRGSLAVRITYSAAALPLVTLPLATLASCSHTCCGPVKGGIMNITYLIAAPLHPPHSWDFSAYALREIGLASSDSFDSALWKAPDSIPLNRPAREHIALKPPERSCRKPRPHRPQTREIVRKTWRTTCATRTLEDGVDQSFIQTTRLPRGLDNGPTTTLYNTPLHHE